MNVVQVLGKKVVKSARYWWLTPVILYSGGRDQEDRGLKAPQANSLRGPILN
jgi:hypothetical protein